MTFFVIATKFDSTQGKQVKYIAGAFNEWHLAHMFCTEYNKHYSANAEVITADLLANCLQ